MKGTKVSSKRLVRNIAAQKEIGTIFGKVQLLHRVSVDVYFIRQLALQWERQESVTINWYPEFKKNILENFLKNQNSTFMSSYFVMMVPVCCVFKITVELESYKYKGPCQFYIQRTVVSSGFNLNWGAVAFQLQNNKPTHPKAFFLVLDINLKERFLKR